MNIQVIIKNIPDTLSLDQKFLFILQKRFFFAKIFNEDGTEADEYDVFFTTTKDIMKEFCEKKDSPFLYQKAEKMIYLDIRFCV